jgi:hypothetical protein
MKILSAALLVTAAVVFALATSLGADRVHLKGPVILTAALDAKPPYVTSPEPGYIRYTETTAALPNPNCYWARQALFDLDHNVIGWRGRSEAVCP